MADAIPVSDPGLLAAQAKAGQAGVDAYNAAISSLQGQKQSAVQQALQESAMRGGPQEAAQSQSGIITAPYDQRIASLTQNLAGYQADQSARTTRMNDYNQAVLGARSYIPQVTEQSVAPLRAQADFQVRNTEMQGQQNVAGIDAETQLTLAKMAAAFQAAQIAAAKAAADKAASGGSGTKISQGELSGLMSSRGAQMLQQSGSQVREILTANEAAIKSRTQQAAASAAPETEASVQKNYWDAMAARYTGNAMQQEAAKTKPKLGSIFAAPAAKVPLPMQVPGRSTKTSTVDQELAQARAAMDQQAQVNAQQFNQYAPTPGAAATVAPGNPSAMAMWQAIMSNARQMNAIVPSQSQGRQQIKSLSEGLKPGSEIANNILRKTLTGLQSANNDYTSIDPQTNRRVLMTPDQVRGLDPFTQEMVMGATQQQGINGVRDFENIVWGTPSADNQGTGNAYSSDVVRNAMVQVAQQLREQGYDIDEAQVANALPAEGQSIYNLLAKQSGQPSSDDAYKAALAADAADTKVQDKAQTTQDKADESAAMTGLVQKYGRKPPGELGTARDVLAALVDNQATVDQATPVLKDIVKNWDPERGGLTASTLTTRLLQAGVSAAIIPLVLYQNGY